MQIPRDEEIVKYYKREKAQEGGLEKHHTLKQCNACKCL